MLDKLTAVFTAASSIAKALGFWLLLIGFFVLALFLFRTCGELRKEKETTALKEAGWTVEKDTKQKDLDAQAAELVDLRVQMKELEAQLGAKPKIITVERLVSDPTRGSGEARPEVATAECAKPPPCLFAPGDFGQVAVDEVHVEGPAGSQVAVWAAKCRRISPEPQADFLETTGKSPLSKVSTEEPAKKPGSELGMLFGVANGAPAGAVFVESAPANIWIFGEWSIGGMGMLGQKVWAGMAGPVKHF
jgi:hypothetical protein